MKKDRTEIFSDGVIAIIITIMVLELKPPESTSVSELATVIPAGLRYMLSFVYIGIYWVNHHALLDRVERVDGAVLWANLHLLFWMSLIPYATAWAGENPMESGPVVLYGVILLMCSISFSLLSWRLRMTGAGDALSWQSAKNRMSIMLYALAIVLSMWYAPFGALIHVLLAVLWLVPSIRKPARMQGNAGKADRDK